MAKKQMQMQPINSSNADQKPISRQRKAWTPEIKSAIAIARVQGLKKGRLTPMSTLIQNFGRDRASISRAVVEAFKAGWVDIFRVNKATLPRLADDDLKKEFLRSYPNLQDAVLIDSDPSLNDDEVHKNLGIAMAQLIATKSIVQKGDVVGVGSGRGVEMTIQSLQDFDRLRAKNVTLMSLTGSVYSTPKSSTKRLWLDADRHVIEFAKYFEDEPSQYLIIHPLVFETDSELSKARKRIWLETPGDGNAVPRLSHIFVGVGIFSARYPHRFHSEAVATKELQEPLLRPIHDDLVRLKKLCDESVANFPENFASDYSPAAEMSNVFFFVPPPRDMTIQKEKAIVDCIERINAKLLNVKDAQIRATQMLVVGGGKRKAHALRALLDDYPVTYLCTDADAARAILSGKV